MTKTLEALEQERARAQLAADEAEVLKIYKGKFPSSNISDVNFFKVNENVGLKIRLNQDF
jgi:hypothetical protein